MTSTYSSGFDVDATFLERHTLAVFVALLVLTAGVALTSLDRTLFAALSDALAAVQGAA